MALIPWPPTSARFLTGCPKPEAFTGNPSAAPPVPGILLTTIDQRLSARASRSAQRVCSDRDGINVSDLIAQMDDGFESIVFALTARDLMSERNFNPKAGADAEIVRLAEEAQKDLDDMASKRVTPNYVLSAAIPRQDSIRVGSRRRSDDWARSDRARGGCR